MGKTTIRKPSLDHNMIVNKVGMTLGPSNRETDKSRGDTETERQTNRNGCSSKQHKSLQLQENRKRYVAWIFDKRMNPLYDSVVEMIPSTDTKILQYKTQPTKYKVLPTKDQGEYGGF
jgi:hypothetical protein